jgi:hypothetical protein
MRGTRILFWICNIALSGVILTACGSSEDESACGKAKGTCESLTPGVCLGQVVGDENNYSCDPGAQTICCLPLTYSACEVAGGACVAVSADACPHGTIGDVGNYGCGNGVGLECCLPN